MPKARVGVATNVFLFKASVRPPLLSMYSAFRGSSTMVSTYGLESVHVSICTQSQNMLFSSHNTFKSNQELLIYQ